MRDLAETSWRTHLNAARLSTVLMAAAGLMCEPRLAHAADQGEAYSACKTEEAVAEKNVAIVAPCFEYAPNRYTYVWQSSGPHHAGNVFWFDAYCSSRSTATALVSSTPPSVMCQTGCAYSASGQTDTADGPSVVYGPTGSVCPKLASAADPDKIQGPPCAGDCPVGDPINAGTGNKYESRTEFRGGGTFPLEFTWFYNSMGAHSIALPFDGVMGSNRTHTYARFLSVQSPELLYVSRPTGILETYRKSGAAWLADGDNAATLRATTDVLGNPKYERRDEAGNVETYRADGRLVTWQNRDGLVQTLSYGSSGLLVSVTDPGGRVLGFRYDGQSRLQQLDLPDGNAILFLYDSANYLGANLETVAYPDGTSISYLYDEPGYVAIPSPHALTGIIDENGNRYSSTTYDAFGRATGTYLAAGVDATLAQYSPASDRSFSESTVLTLPSGAQETRTYLPVEHLPRQASSNVGGAGSNERTTATSYDVQGRLDQRTDALGNTSNFDFDALGRLTSLTLAENSAGLKRTIQIDWSPDFNVPLERRTLDASLQLVARESWTYNARGQVATANEIDVSTGLPTRTSRFSYCEVVGNTSPGDCPFVGLLAAVDGPRADVSDTTAFTYYFDSTCESPGSRCSHHRGDLWKVTNALGQIMEFVTYDDVGHPTRVKDQNGVFTDLEYSARGRLISQEVRGADDTIESDDAVTAVEYWPTGEVKRLVSPDGASVRFSYDAVHRLTDVTDALGNSAHYTLDNAGNRVAEALRDSNGSLKHSLSRIFDSLGQLKTFADAAWAPTDFSYDLNGNLDTSSDPLQRVTDNTFDALGRLTQVIANVGGTGSEKSTSQFEYDARDNLTAVVDPKGLRTSYNYNGFGELARLNSPDTQVTSYEYDQSGNLGRTTDARGRSATLTYDALGRPTAQLLPTTAQNVYFDYDAYWYGYVNNQPVSDCAASETFGVGRLAGIRDESGGTRYCYDRRGNLVRKAQTVVGGSKLTVGATYNGADRLVAMTYPSGAIVTYQRNGNGQISGVSVVPSVGQQQATLVSAVGYLPFGPLTSLSFGNGRVLTKSFDGNYDIDKVSDSAASNPLIEDFGVDVGGRITSLAERTSATVTAGRAYSYDGQDRLTWEKNGTKVVEGFAYDATGNRLSKTVANKTTNYSYPAASHRLTAVGNTSRTYDANGNTTAMGTGGSAPGFSYDDRNRLRDYKVGSSTKASYRYNGQGEQVLRIDTSSPANSRQYVYDQTGHLLGEYTTAGVRIQEYVWLDDTLVGILSAHDGSTYQYVETDHLGTPRAVVHPAKNTIIWRWDVNGSTFGDHAPAGDPDSNGITYTLNLRYPGQRADPVSGLYYNYFRDYEAATGRYVESDSFGLIGGLATYGYAGQGPFRSVDPFGADFTDPLYATVYSISGGWSPEQNTVDAINGFADGLTGIPFTETSVSGLARNTLDAGSIDECSIAYRYGDYSGQAAAFIGGAALISKSFLRKAGTEWSHAIPGRFTRRFTPTGRLNADYKRWLDNPVGWWVVKGPLNGNYVAPFVHRMSDPFRQLAGMTKSFPRWNAARRFLNRIPGWIPGAAAASN